MKAELKTNSDVVQGGRSSGLSSENLKNVIDSAVQDEDRGKNVLVFGRNVDKS